MLKHWYYMQVSFDMYMSLPIAVGNVCLAAWCLYEAIWIMIYLLNNCNKTKQNTHSKALPLYLLMGLRLVLWVLNDIVNNSLCN
jgi:hypothetical protein